MVFLPIFLMMLLAWRLGAFEEVRMHRELESFQRHVYLDMDEAEWEDRQVRFRNEHPRMGHRRPHMSLGRRR